MNQVREAHHVRPLRADARLDRAARSHSSKMLRTGVLFHGSVTARVRSVGVHAPRVGENLAWGVGRLPARRRSSACGWRARCTARNLLDPRFDLVGIGALRGSFSGRRGALLITTDFAG